MASRFRDRSDAGQQLATKLAAYANRPDVLVLALPRGGVPVAFEVAKALNAPLDIFLVRTLGMPGHKELAMGAIAPGGVVVRNEEVLRMLPLPQQAIDALVAKEQRELERHERLYHSARPACDVCNKIVILVDDGLASGTTLRAAAAALRQRQPERIVVAVPTAAPKACDEFRAAVDEVVCAITPLPFDAAGSWYDDVAPTTEDEVRNLLELAARRHAGVARGA
jgi:predicted phosphoribosyltransferase